MRNFDETMEAIRSRSKARIAKRKKYIATCSSALVLCIAMTGTLFLPGTVTAPMATEVPTATQSLNTTAFAVYIGDVLATGVDGPEILRFIDSLEEGSTSVYSNTDTKTASEDVAQSLGITYRLEVTDDQGSLHSFTLAGNLLTDEDTETVYVLNSYQRLRLLRLLQIVKE